MADGPNLPSKPTGQLYLPCPTSELELHIAYNYNLTCVKIKIGTISVIINNFIAK